MENLEIRETAKACGVCLWEVAERVGVNDGNFSRKLRRELPEAERAKILDIVHAIAREKMGGA